MSDSTYEEINDWEEASIDDSKHQIRGPLDVINHNRRNHDHGEIEQPVGAGRDGVSLGPRLDRVDLCRIQPGKRKPCCAEKGNIAEQTDRSTLGRRFSVGDQASEHEDHGKTLPKSTDEEEFASTSALDDEP